MPPAMSFWIAFATTLVLLVASLTTGVRKVRRVHIVLGPATMLALLWAIISVERLSRAYSFPADAFAIHIMFAKCGAALAFPVIVTGVWLARSEKARLFHRWAVAIWLVSVLTATGTGLWMFSLGELKAG